MISVDTGAFVALFNQQDPFHASAQSAFQAIQEPLITTYPVITETSYLLLRSVSNTVQLSFLRSLCLSTFEIFQIQPDQLARMVELMERYADLPMDFVDASLVVLAEHLGHGRILTVDRRDFMTYRWHDTKPFENLLLVNP